MQVEDYEKLGAFYLGRPIDDSGKPVENVPLLYDSKDLVTHAVCVGMTGSGKTGLCLGLLEEAAIDGIPAIVIDPKGDLSNLLLAFPQLRAEDFAPWINEDDARRKGVEPAEFAQQQADLWRKGLASWGQSPERIQKLKDSADFAIYTPGSSAGLQVSILKSFAVPSQQVMDDRELLQDQIRTTVTGLLGLVEVDSDPMTGREHILLSNILSSSWQQGSSLDLAGMIQQIQSPPVQRVGVMDVESFFPQKDRFALAMRLNNLLAAPGFENWLNGEPLEIGPMLFTREGKPRVSVFSIAHLSDAERMFFVSLLLNQVLGWMRSQSGTTSLRAIVYMDEIFGYFPPTQNPPSKQPLLTLLKQARAFGVGVMLATQNPVDLDYKGLANAGTWFIGRLQTERDKARVMEGLEGASASAGASFDKAKMERTLAGLGSRRFLMNNVHDDEPVVFETRWALSYMRGPLTRDQIRALMSTRRGSKAAPAAVEQMTGATPPAQSAGAMAPTSARPVFPPQVKQFFLPVRSVQPAGAELVYEPCLLGTADVYFNDAKSQVMQNAHKALLASFTDGPVPIDWTRSEEVELSENDLETDPQPGAQFAPVHGSASQAKSFDAWSKSFADALYRMTKVDLLKSASMGMLSKPNEPEREFRARLALAAREARDEQVDKLRTRYAPKINALNERIRKAHAQVRAQQEQSSASKWGTAISLGATVLGAMFGRKSRTGTVGRAATTARGMSRSMKESADVARAEENVEALQQQLADLDAQFQSDVSAIESRFDASTEPLETVSIRPKKTDIKVRFVALGWRPMWRTGAGQSPAWR